jgi:hypothetical protein
MARANKNKKQNQLFSGYHLSEAINHSHGYIEEVVENIYAATKKGYHLSVEALVWLRQNASEMPKDTDQIIIDWFKGIGIELVKVEHKGS